MNKFIVLLVLCLLAITVCGKNKDHKNRDEMNEEQRTQEKLRQWEEGQDKKYPEVLENMDEKEQNQFGEHGKPKGGKHMKNSNGSESNSESESESEEYGMYGEGKHHGNKHGKKGGHHGKRGGHHGKKGGHHGHHGKPGPECIIFLILVIIVIALTLRCCFKKCHKRKLKKIERQRQQLQNSGVQVPQAPFHVPQPVYVQNAQPLYSTVDAHGNPHVVMGAPIAQPQPQQQQPQQVWGVHLNQQQPVQTQISQPVQAQAQQPVGVYVPPRQQQGVVVQSPEGYQQIQMTDRSAQGSQYPEL